MTDHEIEIMARAAYEQWQAELGCKPEFNLAWNKIHPTSRASWLRQQRAAIDALRQSRK